MRAAAVAAAVAVAGCGSDDPKVATTPPATTTATQQPNAEPKGKLSAPEYRSLRAAFELLVPLQNSKDARKVLRIGRRACIKVTTQTDLLAAVHADCVQTMRFYEDVAAMVTRKAECTKAAQAGDMSCFAELFRSVGRSARVAGVRSGRVNEVLRKRGIRGSCAQAIGTERKQLAAARDAQRDGIRAAHALEAKNEDALQRAAKELQADLDRMDAAGTAAADSYRQLRSCV